MFFYLFTDLYVCDWCALWQNSMKWTLKDIFSSTAKWLLYNEQKHWAESRPFIHAAALTHSKSLINRTVQACLQDSAAAGRLISCQPTQMTSAEVTQHESCVDGDTWFLSLWVIGIIFHLSAQHYLNWWRPCVWCGCTTFQYRQSSTPSVLSLTLSVILFYLISAVKKL